MKKVLSVVLIMILLSTSVSFCNPSDETTKLIKDLDLVNNNVGIIIRNILSREYDKESITPDLKYNNSIINNIYNDLLFEYKEGKINIDKTALKKREEGTIFYIATLYSLALNGIELYLEDKDANEMFLLDAISQYREGMQVLDELEKETAN